MELFQITSGLLLLAFGRRLFWLFISLMGFAVGMEVAGIFLIAQPFWLTVAAGIVTGLIGAVAAIFAQRVAFALAGFFAGGYLVFILAQIFGTYSASNLFFIIGGISGALLSVLFMDIAIVLFSCFAGAGMIIQALAPGRVPGFIIFALLVAMGVYVQGLQLKGAEKRRAEG